ncbi:MAG: HD domain-containing protein, partial [Myxococcales bacterium]|nr:HD domain-containing protein [Myxococcales bacterium]
MSPSAKRRESETPSARVDAVGAATAALESPDHPSDVPGDYETGSALALAAYGKLEDELAAYLDEDQVDRIHRAFEVGDEAHVGQTRKSGEPYITHPLAVATILAEMRLDEETICAAILHDVLEDTEVGRATIAGEFGETVADLVDGVTKLDKLHFRDRQEAAAESFRKMLLA